MSHPPLPTVRAGFARLGISPPRDTPLIGYAFRYEQLGTGNEGPPDGEAAWPDGGPLYVRCMAIDAGGPAMVVSLDLATLERGVARRLRQAVAERIGTSLERVLICCTHTHSGPYPIGPGEEDEAIREDAVHREQEDAWSVKGRAYFEQLLPRVVTCAAMAAGKLVPMTLAAQQGSLGIGYVRRVPDGEGGVSFCWNPQEQDDLPLVCSPDPTCTAVVLRQVNGPRSIVLFNAGAHPVILGKTSNILSADWPGAACDIIERLCPGSRAMFALGPCGDIHPWIATQEDPANIEPVATAAAGLVASLTHAARPVGESGALELHTAARTVTFGRVELDLVAWRLGQLRIIAAPVELFSGLGARVRQALAPPLLIATETNGRSGYWPTQKAFREGGYEVDIARNYGLEPGDGEKLAEVLISLVKELDD